MKLTRVEAEIIIETAFPDITLREAREALNNLDEAGVIQEKELPLGSITMPTNKITFHEEIHDPCKSCPNHPSNGGSGKCLCTLGTKSVSCTASNTFSNAEG